MAAVDLDEVARALGVTTDDGIVDQVGVMIRSLDALIDAVSVEIVDVECVSEFAAGFLGGAIASIEEAQTTLGVVVDAAERHERGVS
ncbi:MAG: hypothetical protein ACRCYU_14910 [Nocardioides sp.]